MTQPEGPFSTVQLPQALRRAARIEAARRGVTIRSLLAEAVAAWLAAHAATTTESLPPETT